MESVQLQVTADAKVVSDFTLCCSPMKPNRGSFVKKESVIFISNDSRHDDDGVAHFMSMTYKYLKEKNPKLAHFEEFSDGCASQYRCVTSIYKIVCAHNLSINPNYFESYFESSHGKSSSDGLGALVKYIATLVVTCSSYFYKMTTIGHFDCPIFAKIDRVLSL